MRFPAVKNCENLLRFDKVTADYKAVTFFSGHGVDRVKLRPCKNCKGVSGTARTPTVVLYCINSATEE